LLNQRLFTPMRQRASRPAPRVYPRQAGAGRVF